MISNTLIVIIDHMFFTKSNTDPNVSWISRCHLIFTSVLISWLSIN
jgi:hypothetical protein